MVSDYLDSRGGTNIARTRHFVELYLHCLSCHYSFAMILNEMFISKFFSLLRLFEIQSKVETHSIYRVSIKSFPAYKHLLQENYVEYKHIFFSKCNSTQEVFLQHISTLQHVLILYST